MFFFSLGVQGEALWWQRHSNLNTNVARALVGASYTRTCVRVYMPQCVYVVVCVSALISVIALLRFNKATPRRRRGGQLRGIA